MSGTNNIPIGPRTGPFDGPAPLDPQPSFRQTGNDHEPYRPPQNHDRVNESSDSYSKRVRSQVQVFAEREMLTLCCVVAAALLS